MEIISNQIIAFESVGMEESMAILSTIFVHHTGEDGMCIRSLFGGVGWESLVRIVFIDCTTQDKHGRTRTNS